MITKYFFCIRIGLFALTYIGSLLFPRIANTAIGAIGAGQKFDYWQSWAQWDGGYYISIAQNGYRFFQEFAFMPLFPFLVRVFANISGFNILLSGLIVANISFLIFLLVLYKLTEFKFTKDTAIFTVTAYTMFPTGFFTAAFYSESTFLMFVVLSFYFLYRKNYLFAAIFCAFASITRNIGIFLFISILYTYFTQINFNIKKIDRQFLQIMIAPFCLVGYMLFLTYKFGTPFLFLTAERFWGRAIMNPIITLFSYIGQVLTQTMKPEYYFDLLVTLIFLMILIFGRRKIPSSLWIFSILVILAGISSGTLVSMPRYVLASIGSFIILGKYFQNNPKIAIPILSVSLILQIILATLFLNGHWIA